MVDRFGRPIRGGQFVGVLPMNTRDSATREEVEAVGADWFGTVGSLDGVYVTVFGDDPGGRVQAVRPEFVLAGKS